MLRFKVLKRYDCHCCGRNVWYPLNAMPNMQKPPCKRPAFDGMEFIVHKWTCSKDVPIPVYSSYAAAYNEWCRYKRNNYLEHTEAAIFVVDCDGYASHDGKLPRYMETYHAVYLEDEIKTC